MNSQVRRATPTGSRVRSIAKRTWIIGGALGALIIGSTTIALNAQQLGFLSETNLTGTAEQYWDFGRVGGAAVFPQEVAVPDRLLDRRRPDSWGDPDRWLTELKEAGGMASSALTAELRLVNSGDTTISVTDIGLARRQTTPPADGVYLCNLNSGASDIESIQIDADQPEPRPTIEGSKGQPYFRARSISLVPGESIVIGVTVTASQWERFAFAVDYQSQEEAGQLLLDDAGELFELSGPAEPVNQNFPYSGYDRAYAHLLSAPGWQLIEIEPETYPDPTQPRDSEC